MSPSLQQLVFALTGAGSGIGRATALALAQEGCRLSLVDQDPDGLTQTIEQIKHQYPSCQLYHQTLDVTDEAAVKQWFEQTLSQFGQVDGLVNNAGIALIGNFDEVTQNQFNKVIAVNLMAPINITRLFLPELKKRPWSVIVNISSLFGLIAPAGNAAYAVSKFGLRGFNEVLRQELMGTTVRIISVHPGGIRTNIALKSDAAQNYSATASDEIRQEFTKKMLRTPPEIAAATIITGIKRENPRVLIGTDAKVMDWFARLFPKLSITVVGKLSQIQMEKMKIKAK